MNTQISLRQAAAGSRFASRPCLVLPAWAHPAACKALGTQGLHLASTSSPSLVPPSQLKHTRSGAGSRRRGGLCVQVAASSSQTIDRTPKRCVLKCGDKEMALETGEIGRQANGAIMATMGETVIYTTACCTGTPSGDGSFLPLTVNYQERFSAAGKTSGGYIKREGRPRDAEVLISRLVDRPLRPMFAKGWANETQVLEWVLSYDGINDPEPLAITAASAALLISDIPFEKAVAGVRVGWVDGKPVINPTVAEQAASKLDLVLAGTRDAVLMIEGYCDFMTEEEMMEAVAAGSEVVSSMCIQMEQWAFGPGGVAPRKRKDQCVLPPEGLEAKVEALVGQRLYDLYSKPTTKEDRGSVEGRLKDEVASALQASEMEISSTQLYLAFKEVSSNTMRRVVVDQGRRMDGRGLTDIRPITARASLLPRTHGSCLFTRGETQAIAVATLGSKADAQRTESIRSDASEGGSDDGSFYLQYFFPPSSVGEVGRSGAPGRRELGHGELAQRALAPVVPRQGDWPYTVRVESTITESNGSSSMASVCGGCLAMLDAGVPLLRPVAGIAMGLILMQEPQQQGIAPRYVVLSDILGSEDALGDMDFKVAGDQETITAFQMDIKVEGITLDIMRSALAQAKDGRRHILGEMAKCSPPPRSQLSPYAPRVVRKQIDPSKKALVIGSGGRTVRSIYDASGATSITIADDGMVEVLAPSQEAADKAIDIVELIVDAPPVGRVFRGAKVISVQPFGAFVEVCPGREGLVHISELDGSYVADATAVVKIGDLVDVSVLAYEGGKLSLSRRAVMVLDGKIPAGTPSNAGSAGAPSGERGPGRGSGGGRGGGRGGSGGRGSGMARRP